MQKPQMKVGPIENSNFGANPAVLHAQYDRGCLGPIETCFSAAKVAVLPAKPQIKAGNYRDKYFGS